MSLQDLIASEDLYLLKSAAYDQIAQNQQGEQILRTINQRIAEVASSKDKEGNDQIEPGDPEA